MCQREERIVVLGFGRDMRGGGGGLAGCFSFGLKRRRSNALTQAILAHAT
jgi:hypothetical protein